MIPNNISLFYKACKNKRAEGIGKNVKYIYVSIILDPNDQILMN
jgi:hypothetical protein